MEPRIFHGSLTPEHIGRALLAEFNRGNLRAQQIGDSKHIIVQIATRDNAQSGGRTAITVNIQQAEDGVTIQMGNQTWLGVAASLGQTAFSVWRNPWHLLERLDDLAQDIENIQLADQVWLTIEKFARAAGASYELSERLRRLTCSYCSTANAVGDPSCIACGAPLGPAQPGTCPNCGFVIKTSESVCPNCKKRL